MMILFKVIVCLLTFSFGVVLAIDETSTTPSFFFILPNRLQYGKNSRACLSLYNIAPPVTATIKLKVIEKDYLLTERSIDKDHSCFEILLPQLNDTTQQANVGIEIRANNLTLKGSNSNEVITRPGTNQVTFLQTDRQIYKPGDIFKIRILILNKDGFAGEKQTIPIVKIKNPDDVTVAVWKDVKTGQGLAHLEYQLSDETVDGQWNIEANGEIKTVEVKKYVLPRFKVELISSEEIYVKANQVEFKVCAKYSYGQPVNKGNVQLNISFEQPARYSQEYVFKHIVNNKELVSGCTQFIIPVKEFELLNDGSWWRWWSVHAKAVVTEAGTNQTEEANTELRFTTDPLKLEINAEEDIFRTGLPYTAEIKFTSIQTPIQNSTIQICYEFEDNTVHHWSSSHSLQTFCSNFTIDAENNVPFTIPPLLSNASTVFINANCCNGIWAYKSLYRIFSTTKSYIYLQQNKSDLLKCENLQHFTVFYTINDTNPTDNLTFQYLVKTDDKLYLIGKVNVHPDKIHKFEAQSLKNVVGESNNYTDYNTTVASFNISFKLDRSFLSKYKILVYSLFPNGDIVVGTKEVELEPCLPNKVYMEWSKSVFEPNEEASLNVKTSQNSLCSISAVDESTKFRSSDNFNIKKLLERLSEHSEEYYYYNNYFDNCPKSQQDSYEWVPEVYSDKDTLQILQEFGVFTISNFNISTKPCRKQEIYQFGPMVQSSYETVDSLRETGVLFPSRPKLGLSAYSAAGGTFKYPNKFKESSGTTDTIRSFFPETWLWDLIPINKNGEAKLVRSVPHSITNWVSNAICVSPTEGVGMSDTKSFITFQPFFIDVITPYSIKRGEILHLVVKVFNYMNYTLPVHVSILQQDGLEILEDSDDVTKCVDASDSADFIYKIRSSEIGKINITVVGEIDSLHNNKCETTQNFERRDVVRKTLLVEAEGFPVEMVKSELLCSNDSHPNELVWTLQLPNNSNLVPDSAKSKLIFNSDILGSTVENLERLLVIPTGCGEQVMSTLAPNLYVLRYLNATNRLTSEIRSRAAENIQIGYQKILTYMHKDGSFSAFGERDGNGSMFLTVFVVRTLSQSKPYIYVDDSVISKSVRWIIDNQLDNGCFPPLHHLFHSLGDNAESDFVLTSYVLISLKEAAIEIPGNVSKKAISCISNYKENSIYPQVLISYALQLNGKEDDGRKHLDSVLKHLPSFRNTTNKEYSYSNDVEVYGYALLSLLTHNNSDSIAQASSMVQWLSKKMSPRGGFASTQDTVVALDALSKYSAIFREIPNISVHFTASGQEKQFRVSADDLIKVTKFNLKRADDIIHLRTSGKGCVLSQAVLTYNVYSLTQKPAFNITVKNEVNSEKQYCVDVKLTTCVVYNTSGNESKMVVMEIKVPSGYLTDEQSLSTYLNQFGVDNKIKRYELNKDDVVIYFVGLTTEKSCVSFKIVENQKVENRTASTVNIFDYYKPENRATLIYELHGCN